MFIRLLSVCRISFGESLVSNLKGTIKCVCQTRPTVVNIKLWWSFLSSIYC